MALNENKQLYNKGMSFLRSVRLLVSYSEVLSNIVLLHLHDNKSSKHCPKYAFLKLSIDKSSKHVHTY